MPKEAKIFVAGASGMVGSAILRNLLKIGYTNLIGSFHSKLLDELKDSPVRMVQLDLLNQEAVSSFFNAEKPEYVFLAAAKVGGIHANNTYPAQFIHDNLVIQSNIIHTAYLTGVNRLLFLGSSCIYPKMAPQPMKEEHLLTGLLEPTNEPYAIAKIAGIKMCEAYNRQYGTQFIAAMPTNLYGPNDNFDLENSHVLPSLIRKFHLARLAAEGNLEGIKQDEVHFGAISEDLKKALFQTHHSALSTQHSTVTVWGTGAPRREFLYVDDMADACVFLMNLDEDIVSSEFLNYPKPCFVNVGTGLDCTIRELAVTVQNAVGFNGNIIFDSSRPDGTPRKLLDVTRLADLGWRQAFSLIQGVEKTYQQYLKSPKKP
jgi:GDP-L-fucose synthase